MALTGEESRRLGTRGDYDVIVCGGGLGGTAAAIAAARAGAKTLLIERNSFLGGVDAAGMCWFRKPMTTSPSVVFQVITGKAILQQDYLRRRAEPECP